MKAHIEKRVALNNKIRTMRTYYAEAKQRQASDDAYWENDEDEDEEGIVSGMSRSERLSYIGNRVEVLTQRLASRDEEINRRILRLYVGIAFLAAVAYFAVVYLSK